MTATDRTRRRVGRVGTVAVTTVATGLAAYATLVLFARVAGSDAYLGFAVLWAAYYAVAACLGGLQQEVVRVAASPGATSQRSLRAWLLPLAAGLVLGSVAAATSPLWAHHVSAGPMLLAGLLLAAVGLAGLVTTHALLVARGLWLWACGLLVADAAVRISAVAIVAFAGGGSAAQLSAVLSGSLVWLPVLPRIAGLPGFGWPSPGAFVRRAGSAMAAAGLAGLLVAGFPALVAAAVRDDAGGTSAGMLAGMVLLRSPVILLVTGFRPYLLVHIIGRGEDGPAAVLGLWRVIAAVGALLTAVVAVAGGPALRLTAGAGFDLEGAHAAALTGSAVMIAMVSLSSLAFVAADRHHVVTGGWAVAVGVSIAVLLLLPGEPDDRVAVAAVAGPVLPLVLHAVSLRSARAAAVPDTALHPSGAL